MARVAVASSSQLAAEAGAEVASDGGNAIDAAVAATLVATVTEPGICSLGGGAFVSVWTADDDPVTIDGNVEMPGRGLPSERFGAGGIEVTTGYAGGTTTIVGHASVATPGTPAALELAHRRFGAAPWRAVVEPARRVAETGFPLGAASDHYLQYVHEVIYGWHAPSHAAVHHADGDRVAAGDTVVIDDLADSLAALATDGARVFYEGDVGQLIARDSEEHGGLLTREDLAAYRPVARRPLRAPAAGWDLATNPPPAVGGAVLAAMLRLLEQRPAEPWDAEAVGWLVEVQHSVLSFRLGRLDVAHDVEGEVAELLAHVDDGDIGALLGSASTVHTSAADVDGTVCAITASSGYGSGVMPPRTGIWMNNVLGEQELNRRGFHAWQPGTRLPSNMAPTVGRARDGAALAIGSPGADRITTAISQVLLQHAHRGLDLDAAIRAPRLHVDVNGAEPVVLHEDGLPLGGLDLLTQGFGALHMMFGAVAVARTHGGVVDAAADPRREGGTAIG